MADHPSARCARLVVALLLASCAGAPTSPSPTSAPPDGSVLLEGGKCCVAAVAGEDVAIEATFAVSASVTEMRTRAGGIAFHESDLADSPWEPFTPTRKFTYVAPINWSGFFVTVQFRNASGAVSPVYVDDISVEGMPSAYPLE